MTFDQTYLYRSNPAACLDPLVGAVAFSVNFANFSFGWNWVCLSASSFSLSSAGSMRGALASGEQASPAAGIFLNLCKRLETKLQCFLSLVLLVCFPAIFKVWRQNGHVIFLPGTPIKFYTTVSTAFWRQKVESLILRRVSRSAEKGWFCSTPFCEYSYQGLT